MVFLDNDACLACGTRLGLRPSTGELVAVGPQDVRCNLHDLLGCSWLVEDAADGRCRSCRLTTVTPPRSDATLVAAWADAEHAKRRLVLECLALGLPIEQVRFELLTGRVGPVTTGHEAGVVTIDVDEADDAHRVALREQLSEPYRTLLGHFRHETGHALWRSLVEDAGRTDAFRGLFGDERADYAAALERHYGQIARPRRRDGHVSAYAGMHPHEDWAETFAHYLHIRSALRTAESAGIEPDRLFTAWRGADGRGPVGAPDTLGEPAGESGADDLLARWLPLTFALNAVNRAMGHDDLYPFVLDATVVRKLGFVHDAVAG